MIVWRPVQHGATDQSVIIRILDSGDGTPETAVEHNTAGIDLEYRRDGATSTDITEAALAALDSAHSDGGIEHIGNGYYRLDIPDAAFASGVSGVLIHGTVTGMVVVGCYVPLVPFDPYTDPFTAARTEPGQGAPAANASLVDKVNYLYKAWRNRKTQTATTYSLYNDDATTVDHKATVADDGTTASRTEITTGP